VLCSQRLGSVSKVDGRRLENVMLFLEGDCKAGLRKRGLPYTAKEQEGTLCINRMHNQRVVGAAESQIT